MKRISMKLTVAGLVVLVTTLLVFAVGPLASAQVRKRTKPANHAYVIVQDDGTSWLLHGDSLAKNYDQAAPSGKPVSDVSVLPILLREGWTPVRETPMSGSAGEYAYSLILLKSPAGN